MTTDIYPLTFEPVFRDYIWGGRNLETLFGRHLPEGRIAESWEISGHPSSPTVVSNGPLAGKTLPELVTEMGVDLVGTASAEMLARGKFPLLVKLLDANRDLSVQVHPNDAYAGEYENGELGKTEMWYILWAAPNAELIYGVAEGVTRESFKKAIESNTLETQLNRIPIKAGDTVFVPSGTVHALLAGTVAAEIQQNSDTTYRVYDWGRVGDDGKPRPLHIDKALDVIDFDRAAPPLVEPVQVWSGEGLEMDSLVACPQFRIDRVTMEQGLAIEGYCSGVTFEIWGCIKGQVRIEHDDELWPAVDISAVGWVLLPATLGDFTVRASEDSVLLRARIPKPEKGK